MFIFRLYGKILKIYIKKQKMKKIRDFLYKNWIDDEKEIAKIENFYSENIKEYKKSNNKSAIIKIVNEKILFDEWEDYKLNGRNYYNSFFIENENSKTYFQDFIVEKTSSNRHKYYKWYFKTNTELKNKKLQFEVDFEKVPLQNTFLFVVIFISIIYIFIISNLSLKNIIYIHSIILVAWIFSYFMFWSIIKKELNKAKKKRRLEKEFQDNFTNENLKKIFIINTKKENIKYVNRLINSDFSEKLIEFHKKYKFELYLEKSGFDLHFDFGFYNMSFIDIYIFMKQLQNFIEEIEKIYK